MLYDHDWSISGDTIVHDLVSRSNTITNVSAGLSRCGVTIEVHMYPIWDDVGHEDAFISNRRELL